MKLEGINVNQGLTKSTIPPATMLSLSRLLLVCLCATTSSTAATTASEKAREINSGLSCNIKKCRTRFTFLRPTRDNVSYILFGDTANNNSAGRSQKQNDGISFNHGEYIYYFHGCPFILC